MSLLYTSRKRLRIFRYPSEVCTRHLTRLSKYETFWRNPSILLVFVPSLAFKMLILLSSRQDVVYVVLPGSNVNALENTSVTYIRQSSSARDFGSARMNSMVSV